MTTQLKGFIAFSFVRHTGPPNASVAFGGVVSKFQNKRNNQLPPFLWRELTYFLKQFFHLCHQFKLGLPWRVGGE